MKLSVNLSRHGVTLLNLLGEARRAALPPLERAIGVLNEVIERETAACRFTELPEPTSLPAARRKLEEEAARLRAVETELDAVTQQLVDYPPRPMLKRIFGPATDPTRQTLQMRAEELQRKFQFARTYHVRAKNTLEAEGLKFKTDQARHDAALATRAQKAGRQIAMAQAALGFLKRNPRSAFWSPEYLMSVAARIQKARSEGERMPDSDLPSDWDLVDVLDIWGKPYQPSPR